MSQKTKTAITPIRSENYPEWYQSVLKAADLSEHSPVRGCMVIKPWGYGIWENLQRALDGMIKETGHQNAYFPLFIPLSYLQKEAQHVEGFAKECAVVTHHRLEKNKEGKLVPAGELEEPLIVRPTSEMIIGHTFSKWVESYRDLPILINQWANVVRWEMRTRMFLRTTEFLWQEGHTVHATKEEAQEEAKKMLQVYSDLCYNYLAMPIICGEKTPSERFPGAVDTYCIEAMMQDRKALQAGTSHFLGQNFSRSCDIKFRNQESELEYGWTTSWGATTRLIGGLIMTHSDDDGLVLPPKIATAHLAIIPIVHNEEAKEKVFSFCDHLARELKKVHYAGQPLNIIVDKRDMRGGEKSWSWIKKGVPLRLEIGPREVDAGQLSLARRDKPHRETTPVSAHELPHRITQILDEIQDNLLAKATAFRDQNTVKIDKKSDFYDFFTAKSEDEIHGGFALCHWNGDPAVEEKIKEDLNVTIRCIPIGAPEEAGKCIITGEPSTRRVIFAKSY
ncbi:MAG: proline--tRNA ligase [Verrucomicrobia bacterium]|nr:proline--tRNA ligase [Verrucomicrobiota bacterium]